MFVMGSVLWGVYAGMLLSLCGFAGLLIVVGLMCF